MDKIAGYGYRDEEREYILSKECLEEMEQFVVSLREDQLSAEEVNL